MLFTTRLIVLPSISAALGTLRLACTGHGDGKCFPVTPNRVLLDQQVQLLTLACWSAIIRQFNNLIFILIELKKVSARRVIGYVMAF
jgi:hypothetical protein